MAPKQSLPPASVRWPWTLVVIAAINLVACQSPQSLIERGNGLFAKGRFEEAALNFRKAWQQDSTQVEALYQLARTEIRLGKAVEAYHTLSAAAAAAPGRVDIHTELADLVLAGYLATGSDAGHLYMRLVEIVGRLEKLDPGSPATLRLTGQLRIADKRFEEAVAVLRRADSLKPNDPDIVAPLFKALIAKGDNVEAERIGKAISSANPQYGPMYDLLYLLYAGQNRRQEAEQVLLRRVQSNPADPAAHLQLASHYAAAGEKDKVDAALLPLTGDRRTFPNGIVLSASFLHQRHRDGDALKLLRSAADAASDLRTKATYRKNEAAILSSQGQHAEAGRVLTEVLSIDQNDDEARTRRARIYVESGKPDVALVGLQDFTTLAKKYPTDSGRHADLAWAYFRTGGSDQAQREWNIAVSQDPKHYGARLGLASLAIQRKEFGQALSLSDSLVTENPKNFEARLIRAIAHFALGQLSVARQELTRLVQDRPDAQEPQVQLGLLNIAEKKFKEAEAIFLKLYEPGSGQIRPLEGLVSSRMAQHQADSAERLLLKELTENPDASQVRLLLANLYLGTGKLDQAIAQLRQLSEVQAPRSDVMLRLGLALQAKGDLAGAITAFQKARATMPTDPTAAHHLGLLYNLAQKKTESIAMFREVVRMRPEDPSALNNCAYALADAGEDLGEALKFALRAQQMSPENLLYRDTAGLVYLKKGQPDVALQIFNGLVQKQPHNATYRYHLALVLLARHDRAAAKEALTQALASRPSKAQEVEIRSLMQGM